MLIDEDIEYKRNTANAAESSNSARFQEFSRLELPRLVRRTLESIVEHEAQPLEDRLKERLVDIVRQCQMQLETMFQLIPAIAASPLNLFSIVGHTQNYRKSYYFFCNNAFK